MRRTCSEESTVIASSQDLFSDIIVGTKWITKHLQGPECQLCLYVHGWKRHMIESVIGHGQLYVFIYCLAFKLPSPVKLDKGTVSKRDGSVWPLLGVTCWHRLCPQWWIALCSSLFIFWLLVQLKKSVPDLYYKQVTERIAFLLSSAHKAVPSTWISKAFAGTGFLIFLWSKCCVNSIKNLLGVQSHCVREIPIKIAN